MQQKERGRVHARTRTVSDSIGDHALSLATHGPPPRGCHSSSTSASGTSGTGISGALLVTLRRPLYMERVNV